MEMFAALKRWIDRAPDPLVCFLGKVHCVYDWARLGIFTGFGIGKYRQNAVTVKRPFNRLPFEPDVPAEFRGMPVAMMACDFFFMMHRTS